MTAIKSVHEYEIRPRKDHRGVDLISDVLPFGRLWYDTPDNAMVYGMHSSCSHDAVIRVYDAPGNVIETHEHKGDFKEPQILSLEVAFPVRATVQQCIASGTGRRPRLSNV